MKSRIKRILIFTLFVLIISLAIYIVTFKGEFRVEFGESVERRKEFIKLLDEHGISSHTKMDHLGRVWVVPDQTKRKAYEEVNKIWDKRRKDEVRTLNEERRL
jgi:hypothetical protein